MGRQVVEWAVWGALGLAFPLDANSHVGGVSPVTKLDLGCVDWSPPTDHPQFKSSDFKYRQWL